MLQGQALRGTEIGATVSSSGFLRGQCFREPSITHATGEHLKSLHYGTHDGTGPVLPMGRLVHTGQAHTDCTNPSAKYSVVPRLDPRGQKKKNEEI